MNVKSFIKFIETEACLDKNEHLDKIHIKSFDNKINEYFDINDEIEKYKTKEVLSWIIKTENNENELELFISEDNHEHISGGTKELTSELLKIKIG